MEAVESRSAVRACEHCRTDNPIDARFCKACGAALRAPPACPKCNAETSIDAKFCANCGAALIGPRPEPAIPAAVASSPPEEPADTHESDETDYRAMLQAEAAMLPAATRPAATNIMSNVLMFVAFLMVMVVVIYKMNQGAPKVRSPFEGGPPPSAARAQPASGAPSGSGTPAAAGAAVVGRIELGEGQQSGGGTMFVILRQAGVTRGPPVAVRRIANPTFPLEFSVTAANKMLEAMPFDGPFDIHVRLDQDGNALTKSADDLVASEVTKGVKPGDPPVVIKLDKRL